MKLNIQKKTNSTKKREFENILKVNRSLYSFEFSKKFKNQNYKYIIPKYLKKEIDNKNFKIEKHWEKIKEINIHSIENIICVICLSKNEEIQLGYILRCNHVFCLSCIINNFIKYKNDCPICHEKIFLLDMKKINIFFRNVDEGDKLDFYLMKKYKDNSKIDFVKRQNFNNFLRKINYVNNTVYQNSIFNDINFFLQYADDNSMDLYLKEFIEFFLLKKLEIFQKEFKNKQYNLIKNLEKTKKHKNPKLEYFYQISSGHNIFIDPIQFKYLFLNKKNDLNKLESEIYDINIKGLMKKSMTFKNNSDLKSLNHVGNLNNFVIVYIDLKKCISEKLFNQYILEIKENENNLIKNEIHNYDNNLTNDYYYDDEYENFEEEILQYVQMEKNVIKRPSKYKFSVSKTKVKN